MFRGKITEFGESEDVLLSPMVTYLWIAFMHTACEDYTFSDIYTCMLFNLS